VSAGRSPTVWEIVAGALLGATVAVRIHDTLALPYLRDFDAPGHLENTAALYRGELPDPASWSGFHPPLAYALAAALRHVLPEAFPLYVGMRLLSLAAGAILAGVVWVALRRVCDRSDAAVAAVAMFGVPAVAFATSSVGNEALCALFVTAVLARLLPPRPGRLCRAGYAAGTGLLAGAAALAKATGILAAPVAMLASAWVVRREPRAALRAAAVLGGTALLLAAPPYLRLVWLSGDPAAPISGHVVSPDAARHMARQPPGERHLLDYLRIPVSTLTRPVHVAPGMHQSVPGLLYASAWSAAHAGMLPLSGPGVNDARVALALLGLLPTALLVLGAARALRREELRRVLGPQILFAAALLAAFAAQTWLVPSYAAVKASYLLPASLPAAALLATGLAGLPGVVRPAAQALLLGIAALCAGITAGVWWWS